MMLVADLLVVFGAFLGVVGGLGVLRFPDFYTRLHAAGVTDTLCAALVLFGLALRAGFSAAAVKLVLIFLFLAFTSPTSGFSLARAARLAGLRPWQKGDKP